jgi:hypothetical protein
MAIVIAVSALNAGFLFGDTELHIQRVESMVNAGFKERVSIDGKNKLTLTNGKSGVVRISDGVHTNPIASDKTAIASAKGD